MERGKLVCFVLLVLAASALSLSACGNRPGQIKGKVTDAQSGVAVAQARVVVYDLTDTGVGGQVPVYQKGAVLHEQVTDEDGNYAFSVQSGPHIVEVWVDDQKVGDQMVQVRSGRSAVTNFQVEPPSP
jgi:hypothetical protein